MASHRDRKKAGEIVEIVQNQKDGRQIAPSRSPLKDLSVCGEVGDLTAVSDGYGKSDAHLPRFFSVSEQIAFSEVMVKLHLANAVQRKGGPIRSVPTLQCVVLGPLGRPGNPASYSCSGADVDPVSSVEEHHRFRGDEHEPVRVRCNPTDELATGASKGFSA